jgi:Tfp pilus assembly protein PilO
MVEKIRELGETRITVSFAVVITILAAIITGLLGWQMVQDTKTASVSERVTKVETCITSIYSDQAEMKAVMNAVRQDQVMFYRSVNPKWQSVSKTGQ